MLREQSQKNEHKLRNFSDANKNYLRILLSSIPVCFQYIGQWENRTLHWWGTKQQKVPKLSVATKKKYCICASCIRHIALTDHMTTIPLRNNVLTLRALGSGMVSHDIPRDQVSANFTAWREFCWDCLAFGTREEVPNNHVPGPKTSWGTQYSWTGTQHLLFLKAEF